MKTKLPEKTAEQLALETKQRTLLDKEIADEEKRFKLLANKKLGRVSLLSGAARNPLEASGGGIAGASGGIGSLLGTSSGTSSRTSSRTPSRTSIKRAK